MELWELNEIIYVNINPITLLHVIACKLGFSISVLAAGSPQPEDGAQAEGCISSHAPHLTLFFFCQQQNRMWEESHRCLWELGNVPSILLVGKNKSLIVSEIPKQVKRERNAEYGLLLCLVYFFFYRSFKRFSYRAVAPRLISLVT